MWIRRVYASHTPSNGKLYKPRRDNSTKGSIGEGYKRIYVFIYYDCSYRLRVARNQFQAE